jgi:rhodanese-related sulfurtransferase
MMAGARNRAVMSLAAMAGVWIMLVFAAGCMGQDTRLLEPEAAAELMRENRGNPDFVILDVRTPEEFRQGYIENAVLIDYYAPDFRDRFARLDRDATIFMYCRSGNRSSHVLALADKLGFRQVFDLRGGIVAWKKAGLPLVKADPAQAPTPSS